MCVDTWKWRVEARVYILKQLDIQKPREDQHLGDIDLMPVVKAWGQGCRE
jgi:hypothetical protein